MGQWQAVYLPDDWVTVWSAEDLKGCFYVFKIPRPWASVFAFDLGLVGTDLGYSYTDPAPIRADGMEECCGLGAVPP